MRAARLLAYLQSIGVRFQVENERLKFSAPKGVITPELRQELAQHKTEVIRLLQAGIKNTASRDTLQPVASSHSPPLSFAQERLWFFEQLEPNSSAYNVPIAVHIRGQLNITALEQAQNEIIRRHAVLRTSCKTVNGQPVQSINPEVKIVMPLTDLQGISVTERFSTAINKATELARRPLNLFQAPLLRSTLFQLAKEEFVFLIVTHHFVLDGWSMGILCDEISTLYDDYSHNSSSSLPDLSTQYSEAVLWQRQQLTGDRLDKTLRFWLNQLDNAPPSLKLPTDRPRPAVQTYRGKTMGFSIPFLLTKQLRELSKRNGVTLFMTLMAALHALLYRYTGQNSILVATAVSNRNRTDFEGIVGSFMNNIIIRTDCSKGPAFSEILQQIKKTTAAAFAHQDLPFEKILMEMQHKRNLSQNPLFQVMLTLHRFSQDQELILPGLNLERLDLEKDTALLDLNFTIIDREKGLSSLLEYNSDLFEPETIERIAGHYQTILAGIVANPDQKLSELPLLPATERHQLLVKWNKKVADYPEDKCIHHFIEDHAAESPDAVAVVCEERQLSYEELNRKANQLAHYLIKLGVGPEVLVGIHMKRSLESVVCIIAILKAGGAYVPLDFSSPEERLVTILRDCKAQVLVTKRDEMTSFSSGQRHIVCLDRELKEIERESEENPNRKSTPENLAYVIYTSGTTGPPKGVAIEHRQLTNYIFGIQEQLLFARKSSFTMVTSFAADLSNTMLFSALCTCGGTLHIITHQQALDPESMCTYFSSNSIDYLKIVPSHLQALLTAKNPEQVLPRKMVILGGESTPLDLVNRIRALSLGCSIVNHYGPTEATIGVLTHPHQGSTVTRSGSLPLGRALPNSEVYLLDKNLQPVPIGVSGEIYIGGRCLARGYINDPELTREKFIDNPLIDNATNSILYKTGDLARYLPDGTIEFMGRIDHQMKIRGFRIEPGEIEAVLGCHPGVCKTVVIDREDTPGEKRLVAYLVSQGDSLIPTNELMNFMKEKLPAHMIPSVFVALESIPLTPNGKVDRGALPAPDSMRPNLESKLILPTSEMERVIADAWQAVLQLDLVGIHDNFFDLGGNSLLIIQIHSLLAMTLGDEVTIVNLFQYPTIIELAQHLSTKSTSSSTMEHVSTIPDSKEKSTSMETLVPLQTIGSRPPLFWVHGGGIVLQPYLELDQPLYGLYLQGMDGLRARYTTNQDVTNHYIRQIRKVQPAGPYYLGGYCTGAASAHHIARQFIGQGEDVKLLFMLYPEHFFGSAETGIDDQYSLSKIVSDGISRFTANISAQRTFSKKMACVGRFAQEITEWIFRDYIYFPMFFPLLCEAYFRTGRTLPPSMRSNYYYKVLHRKIRASYVQQPYQKDIIVIESKGVTRDWRSITTGNVTTHLIEAVEHLEIIKEPHVGPWAELLSMYLKQRQKDYSNKVL